MPPAPVRALQSVRRRGVAPTIQIGRREVRRRCRHRLNVLAERRFDRRLGVQTADNLVQPGLGEEGSEWVDSRMYTPTPVPLLRHLLGLLPVDPAACTFLDMGSGKGRGPLVAAELGYRRAVGVELSEPLHATAVANAEAYRRSGGRSEVEFVNADATTYRFPPGPLVLFMYDPFGESTMRVVAGNLARALGDQVTQLHVVYFAPDYREIFDEMPSLTLLAEGDPWCIWGPADS